MNIQQIQNALAHLSLEEIQTIKGYCNDIIAVKAGANRNSLRVGQTITVNHKKAFGMQFKIEKLNNVKAKVLQIYPVTSRRSVFTVPYSLIQVK